MIFLLAWITPAPAPPRTVQPVTPPAVEQLYSYMSELPRSGIVPEMFDRAVPPRAELVRLFSTDDYPLESILKAQEGAVAVVLRIGLDGRVTDCIVERSSGFSALDGQTCRILWTRARFDPARDRFGKPIESATRTSVRWVLPEPPPVPLQKWTVRLTLEFVEEGGIVSCKSEASGAMKIDPNDCNFLLTMAGGHLAKLRADAGYRRQRVVMETQFEPGSAAPRNDSVPSTALYARQVVRLTIDENGKPLQCRVIATQGPESPEGCNDLLEGKYEKPPFKAGAIEATVTRSLFVGE